HRLRGARGDADARRALGGDPRRVRSGAAARDVSPVADAEPRHDAALLLGRAGLRRSHPRPVLRQPPPLPGRASTPERGRPHADVLRERARARAESAPERAEGAPEPALRRATSVTSWPDWRPGCFPP